MISISPREIYNSSCISLQNVHLFVWKCKTGMDLEIFIRHFQFQKWLPLHSNNYFPLQFMTKKYKIVSNSLNIKQKVA